MHSTKRVIVTGDVTIDWNLARLRGSKGKIQRWGYDDCTRATSQPGGAALLANLIDAIAKDLNETLGINHAINKPEPSLSRVNPGDNRFHHSYALWSLFDNEQKKAWRVEEYLGLDRCLEIELSTTDEDVPSVDDLTQNDLLVLDDADLGFRDHHEHWSNMLKPSDNQPWILLKMAQPVAQGPLWEHLLEHFSDRLIVVTTVNDLRRTEVQISEGLSWERTAQDVVWELVQNPLVNGLARCAGVVVSFDTAGAVTLWHSPLPGNGAITNQRQLVFDPKVIERMWEESHPGGMIGYTTCLIAGVARQFMVPSEEPDLLNGIQNGLAAMRDLHLFGYENNGEAGRPNLIFPLQRISETLTKKTSPFAVADIQDPVRFLTPRTGDTEKAPAGGYWTILQDRYRDKLEQMSDQIVLYGPEETLQDVPLGVFGKLLTVDRQEIESFRSIHTLVNEYLSQDRPKRPLSIAVFGAPGSGKSFGITQVAKSIAPNQIEKLEFNLSQFESAEELIDALHQVRDLGLSGKIPLVFWDEFDTPHRNVPLGWLRYFLAPMQDGKFREEQLVHPIGRAIFVFAGGTSARMEDFGRGLDSEIYRSSKVPDFISRLKGFVNILGPNPQGKVEGDPYYIIRRAILLRSILHRDAHHLFDKEDGMEVLNIDRGVLRAFLKTSEYKHGIRSLESIGAMSQLAEKQAFERSCLPSEAQLDLHVDGQEFLSLVQQMDLTGELLEKLAVAAHNVFCAQLESEGYKYGEKTDDDAKTHCSLVPYQQLPNDEKVQNQDLVRDIATKLDGSGYTMIPARSNEPAFEFPGDNLEAMAELEHERWMRLKLEAGWQYAPQTDKAKKLHAAMQPWEDLSALNKEKDRLMVRRIPQILAHAGYTIVRMQD